MYNITIVGSGPSSLFTALYLTKTYPSLKICILSKDFRKFHCTYGVFLEQIENNWIFKYIDKNKFFLKILKLKVKFDSHEDITLNNLNYGLIDNDFLHFYLIETLKNHNVKMIEGVLKNMKQVEELYILNYKNKYIYTNFIIRATGKNLDLDDYPNFVSYKQYFVGYKIKINQDYNLDRDTCTLLNWDKIDNNKLSSFLYVVPYKEQDTFLFEETVLASSKTDFDFNLLKTRLLKRLEQYGITKYEILKKEITFIPLNLPIQDKFDIAFKIGQCGNMINTLSGYTIGYNLYHIPEYCDLIVKGNFKLKHVVDKYWCFKRKLINSINLIGLKLLDNLTQEEISEFHYYYFKYIVSNNYGFSNFKLMFLNCDNINDFSYYKLIISYFNYINFPKKYLWIIAKTTVSYLINI